MKRVMKASPVMNSLVRFLPAILVLTLVVGALVWLSAPAYAHGESISVDPAEAKPGDSVTVTGEEFPPGEEVELSLEGVRGNIPLGHAEVDETGSFSIAIKVPSSAAPGSYQFVVAAGGDNTTLDYTILKAATQSISVGSTELVYERSTSETVVIGLIAAILAIGCTLLVITGMRKPA